MMPTTTGIRIGAGVVATIVFAGSTIGCSKGLDAMSCVPVVVTDPAASLDGYARFTPAQKQNNPNAQDPMYVFLAAGSEAVVIPGPNAPAGSEALSLNGAAISLVGATATSAEGDAVAVNQRLAYQVSIADFEYEVTLARLELCDDGQTVTSQFVFRGNPGASGVAHAVLISAVLDGVPSVASAPIDIEVR